MSKINKIARLARDAFRYNATALLGPLRPKYVLIALTYKCNSRCVMCNIWKMHPKNELTFLEWSQMMKDPIFMDIERLDITGGEALLLPNAPDLISLFIHSMPKLQELSIVSNGFATKRIVHHVAKIAALCRKKNIQFSVSISIDGVGKTHDAIRRVPNGFSSASDTLLRLKRMEKSHHIDVSSGSLVLRQNLSKVDEMRHWFDKHGIQYSFQIVGFHDTYVRNKDTQKSVDFTYEEKRRLEQFLLQESKPKSLKDARAYYWRDLLAMYRDGKRRTTPCPFLKDHFAIDSLGNVYYCFSSATVGNYRTTHSVSSIYFNKKNLERRKNMWNTVCAHCNSGCQVGPGTLRDAKAYAWFLITGTPWYGVRG